MPTQCLKTAKKRYEDKVLYFNSRSNKYETLLLELKKKEETLIKLHETLIKLVSDEKIKEDLTIYKDIIDSQKLFREFELFYTIKSSLNLDNFEKLYSYLKLKQDFRESFKTGFPNILVLLKIYLTSPIASVTSERGFSCLKRIKTYLRSTMLQERLSSLAILNFESEFIKLINIEDVIDEFASNKNRKFAFF